MKGSHIDEAEVEAQVDESRRRTSRPKGMVRKRSSPQPRVNGRVTCGSGALVCQQKAHQPRPESVSVAAGKSGEESPTWLQLCSTPAGWASGTGAARHRLSLHPLLGFLSVLSRTSWPQRMPDVTAGRGPRWARPVGACRGPRRAGACACMAVAIEFCERDPDSGGSSLHILGASAVISPNPRTPVFVGGDRNTDIAAPTSDIAEVVARLSADLGSRIQHFAAAVLDPPVAPPTGRNAPPRTPFFIIQMLLEILTFFKVLLLEGLAIFQAPRIRQVKIQMLLLRMLALF